MAARTVRIGFVGAGGIAAHHIEILKEIPEAQIVALCDINAERVREVAKPLGAEVYTDSKKMLDEVKLDALYVCVPPFAHGDIEVRAAEKGLHIFVEKPVNLFMDKAQLALAAIKKAGVFTQVGYSLRYLASAVQLKRFLEDKPVGTAHIFRWGGVPGVPWWRRMDQSGGQLVEMTTHQVDLLRWVMGEITAVSASYSTNRILKDEPNLTIPDSQCVLLTFASGAVATVNTSCGAGKSGLGMVEFVIKDAKVSWKHDGLSVSPEEAYKLPAGPRDLPNIDSAFIRAIVSGNASLIRAPYEDSIKSAAVTIAANLSAAEGGRVVKLSELLPG